MQCGLEGEPSLGERRSISFKVNGEEDHLAPLRIWPEQLANLDTIAETH